MTVAHVASGGIPKGRDDITVSGQQVPVVFYRTDGFPTIFAGFRVAWFDADLDDGGTVHMAAGAGFGSKYLTLEVDVPGHATVHEYVDMAELFRARVESIMREIKEGTA